MKKHVYQGKEKTVKDGCAAKCMCAIYSVLCIGPDVFGICADLVDPCSIDVCSLFALVHMDGIYIYIKKFGLH